VTNSNNIFNNEGNVGIGVGASPAAKLDVASAGGTALKLNGDFYNQEMAWSQSSLDYSLSWADLRSVTITTHGTGTNNSAVLINAYVSVLNNSGTYGYFAIRITRDGSPLNCLSSVTMGDYDWDDYWGEYLIATDRNVSLTWIDEPSAGSHTYVLQYSTAVTINTWYGSALNVVEIKR